MQFGSNNSHWLNAHNILGSCPVGAIFQALDNLFILCYILLGENDNICRLGSFLSGTSYLTLFRRNPCTVKII